MKGEKSLAGQSLKPNSFRQDLYGSAHWMEKSGIERLGMAQAEGVVIGQMSDGTRLYSREGHMVVFAPTRAGKGIGFVQANLADYPGSMVVLDPKGENAIVSAKLREQNGHEVVVLDPFGKTRMPSTTYNPLGALAYADDYELAPSIAAMVDALVIEPSGNKDPYWVDGAKRFCTFLMWWMVAHEPPEKRNLNRMHDLAHSGHEHLSKMAAVMREGRSPQPELARMCRSMGSWYLDRNEKELSSFDSIISNNFGWIGGFVWAKALDGPPSPPLPLKRSGKPLTVYLVLPFKHMKTYQRWLRLMVADCLSALFDTEGAPKIPVLFLLDEAYRGLGRMDALFDAFPTVASAGGRLCFVYQDVPLLQKEYPGSSWESIVANSKVSLFFAVNDMLAAEYISRRCGTKTTMIPGRPEGMQEPLIRPEAVLGLPKDEVLAIIQNEPPARFGRLNVLTDPRYSTRLARNTTYDEPEEKTHVMRSGYVPVDFGEGGAQQSGRLEKLSEATGLSVQQLSALEKEFGTLQLRGTQLGYIDENGYFEVVAEQD